jgi:integrase
VPIFQPTYRDPKTLQKRKSKLWWYDFVFAGKRVREPAKTKSKTVAKEAEKKRRRELEEGYNGLQDSRDERIKTVAEIAKAYLDAYRLRHRSVTFAEYAIRYVTRHVGELMTVDISDKTVKDYQTARLKEKAAPKTINEEVGFLLRILGGRGDVIRATLRREKALKLKVRKSVGKAYTTEQKAGLFAAAKKSRSRAIYPALMLALNTGMRSKEVRHLQWGRVDLSKAFLTVGDSKTEAARSTEGALQVVYETLRNDPPRVVRIPRTERRETQAGAEKTTGPHEPDDHSKNVVENSEENSGSIRTLARQPTHAHHRTGRERTGIG